MEYLLNKAETQEILEYVKGYIDSGDVTNYDVDDLFLNIDKYSEEETVIGQWTDGKPIYRKVVKYDNISCAGGRLLNIGTVTNDFSANIDIIVKCYGYSTQCARALPYTGESQWIYTLAVLADSNNAIQICTGSSRNVSNDTIYVTLEYTKTTDAANSFTTDMITNNIQVAGVGYENYSEEEVVIGKWIDGKPIYQKTLKLTSPTNNKIYDTEIPVSYEVIDFTVNIKCVGTDNSKWGINTTYMSSSTSSYSAHYLTAVLDSNSTNHRIRTDLGTFWTSSSVFYVTLKYTK